MTVPCISVVVAAYNAEKYIRQCVDSIVNQSFQSMEIILVDDGSTDNTLEILNDYPKKDSRVVVLTQDNKGAGAARNKGLDCAQGKYLLFLDADDFFETNMVETLYNVAEKDKLDVAICQAFEFDDQTHRTGKIMQWAAQKKMFSTEIFSAKSDKLHFFQYINTWAWNKLISSELVKTNNIRFQELMSSNDNLFVTAVLCLAKRIKIIDDPLIYYRLNNPNSLQRSKEKTWDCSLEAVYAVEEMLRKYGIYEDYLQSFLNKSLRNVYYYYKAVPFNSPSKSLMYDRIFKEFVPRYGLLDRPDDYYYDSSLLFNFKWIKDRPPRSSVIPIVFASDNNYAMQLYVTAYSILKNKEESTCIDFYLLIDDTFEERYIDDVKSLAQNYPNVEVHAVRMGDRFDSASITIDHITVPTYYRLAMADILPESYDKCLYLDTDVIVTSDLSEYFSIDLGDDFVAGVKAATYIMNYSHWGYLHSIGISDVKKYINAGAVLYNLKKIRECGLTEVLMSKINCGYSSQDQDIINSVFAGHIRILPLRCNVMTKYPSIFDKTHPEHKKIKTVYSDVELADAVRNPLIIHYAGSVKPWKGLDQHYSDLWWEYAKASPYEVFAEGYKEPVIPPEEQLQIDAKLLLGKVASLEKALSQQSAAINSLKKSIDSGSNCFSSKGSPIVSPSLALSNLENLEIAAIRGNCDAAVKVGRLYIEGKGVEKNVIRGIHYLELAEQGGSKTAHKWLFDAYLSLKSEIYDKKAHDLSLKHSQIGDHDALVRLGRAYRDGKGVKKDLQKAEELIRAALSSGSSRRARVELFDLLWMVGTPDSLDEAVRLAEAGDSEGDLEMSARLARCYRDGKGVEKDIAKAAELMRAAAASGSPRWARWEHFDILWKIGTSESLDEAARLAEAGHANGIPEMTACLVRCYRDGKGVKKDFSKALSLSKSVSGANIKWANDDYVDLLLSAGDEQSVSEAYRICLTNANKGDPFAQCRLARMFRDGKGTEPDMEEAIRWMREASQKNPGWAPELVQMLMDSENPDYESEAFAICSRENLQSYKMIVLRRGQVYLYGIGTDVDLVRAKEYLEKALEMGVQDAKNELKKCSYLIAKKTDHSNKTLNCSMDPWDGTGLPKSLGEITTWFEKEYCKLQSVDNLPKTVEGRSFSDYLVHSLEGGIDEYNFIVCSDKNLADYLFVLIYSISKNCSLPSTIYVLQSDYPDYVVDLLHGYSTSLGVNIRFISVDDGIFDKICEYSGRSKQWPNAAYYYLLAHEYLPSSLTRALYLDIDTIVLKDIRKLYSIDFEGSLICASTGMNITEKTTIQKEKMIFNSGVLLLNLESIRNAGITIDDYVDCASTFNEGFFADQQIVNTMFFTRCKLLPRCYYNALINYEENVRSLGNTNIRSAVLCNEIDEMNSIVHYIGKDTIKAWLVPSIMSDEVELGTFSEKTQYLYHLIWWNYSQNIPSDILKRILLRPKMVSSCDNQDYLLTALLSLKTQLNWLHIYYYYTIEGRRQELLNSISYSSEKEYFVNRYVRGDLLFDCDSICKDLIDDAVRALVKQ